MIFYCLIYFNSIIIWKKRYLQCYLNSYFYYSFNETLILFIFVHSGLEFFLNHEKEGLIKNIALYDNFIPLNKYLRLKSDWKTLIKLFTDVANSIFFLHTNHFSLNGRLNEKSIFFNVYINMDCINLYAKYFFNFFLFYLGKQYEKETNLYYILS